MTCPSVATYPSADCWFSELQLSVLVYYQADLIIIPLKINLFSAWYTCSWIKEQSLTHNSQHSVDSGQGRNVLHKWYFSTCHLHLREDSDEIYSNSICLAKVTLYGNFWTLIITVNSAKGPTYGAGTIYRWLLPCNGPLTATPNHCCSLLL